MERSHGLPGAVDLLDITDDDIASLGDADLRELVGRLIEATLRKSGLPTSAATWGGHQDAADGGLDARVDLDAATAIGGFVPRPATGYQVKRSDLAASAIIREMRPGGVLRPSIAALADAGGAYVLACSGSDLTATMRRQRLQAMSDAVADHPNAAMLKLAFYDRQQLATWLRDHPGLLPWARSKAGRPMRGWRSHGPWSHAGRGFGQEFLLDDALRVTSGRVGLRSGPREGSSLPDGIAAVRAALSAGGGAVRLVGLSGVGKTRFAEALFDEAIGTHALDPTSVIYADVSHGPEPGPLAMVSQLALDDIAMVVVLDNCGPDLHRQVTDACKALGSKVCMLTIEYDIRDDQPEGTDVFHLDAASPSLVAELVRARFPAISQVDADTIGTFSGGNARIGVALADAVARGGSLAGLSDEELFLRLFEQRHPHDAGLLHAASACALVYSFNGDPDGDAPGELDRLAMLAGCSAIQMHRHASELHSRGLLQERGPWRAVLPHAIADRLAKRAIADLPASALRAGLVDAAQPRLLRSFARRLGYMHDSAAAVRIASGWLSPGGLLGDVSNLDGWGLDVLLNVAPAVPEAVLGAIERAAAGGRGETFLSVDNPHRAELSRLLRKIAYEAPLFRRCSSLLVRLASAEPPDQKHDSVVEPWRSLFPLFLSGTHAPVEIRMDVVAGLLASDDERAVELGAVALNAAMQTDFFSSPLGFEFGANRRDHGFHPDTMDEIRVWFAAVVRTARTLGVGSGRGAELARSALASNFRGLWTDARVHDELEAAAVALASDGFWADGWAAILDTAWQCRGAEERFAGDRLSVLKSRLAPASLRDLIEADVLQDRTWCVDGCDTEVGITAATRSAEARAEGLGMDATMDAGVLGWVIPKLLPPGQGHVHAFSRGLAKGARDRGAMWARRAGATVEAGSAAGPAALAGFASAWIEVEPAEARAALDATIEDPGLGRLFPILEGAVPLDALSPKRLRRSIAAGRALPGAYHMLAFGPVVGAFAAGDRLALLAQLADASDGWWMAVEVLASWFRFSSPADITRFEFRDLGRSLLTRVDTFGKEHRRRDHDLAALARTCLAGHEGQGAATIVCTSLAAAFEGRLVSAHGFHALVSALFATQPLVALDAFLPAPAGGGSSPLWSLTEEFGGHRANPLAAVSDDVLLRWCGLDPGRNFEAAACCIPFACPGEGGEGLAWTSVAQRVVLGAPDRLTVLRRFTQRFVPRSWSGSRAAIVERNLDLLVLVEGWGDEALATAARDDRSFMLDEAGRDRALELQRGRDRDERFE